MKAKAADFLILDKETGVYKVDPEQAVRDDVEKHYWRHVMLTIAKDWRLSNPTVGRFSDLMTAMGGTTVLTNFRKCSVQKASCLTDV